MKFAALSLVLGFASLPATAAELDFRMPAQCQPGDPHQGHGEAHDGAHSGDMMPMDEADRPAHVARNLAKMAVTMPAMQQGMMIEDPDIAFACGMIAHHQGAIDMAEVLLEHGRDPQMRQLAEGIIAAQKDEIADMTAWLADRDR